MCYVNVTFILSIPENIVSVRLKVSVDISRTIFLANRHETRVSPVLFAPHCVVQLELQ